MYFSFMFLIIIRLLFFTDSYRQFWHIANATNSFFICWQYWKCCKHHALIFTEEDPFDQDYMIYTVHNQCQEVPDLEYNDGLVFYYFNASGTKGGTPAIKAMLNYLKNSSESNVINNDIRELHQYVTTVKLQPEVRDEYMHLDELIAWHRKDGFNDGFGNGFEEAIFNLLSDYGKIPEDLKEQINNQKDISILRQWHKLAARSDSIEDFRRKIQ